MKRIAIKYACFVAQSCLTLAMPCTVAHKAPMSTGFSGNGLGCHLSNQYLLRLCTAGGFFTTAPSGKPSNEMYLWLKFNFQTCLRSLTLKCN